MQQAYQAIRVISEAQTVHIVLSAQPGALMLMELKAACQALQTSSGDGIKAVILEFNAQADAANEKQSALSDQLEQVRAEVRTIPQPVLVVVGAHLSDAACTLFMAGDFTLIAHEAEICWPAAQGEKISGAVAVRRGYATWGVPAAELNQELERVLTMLRNKSALALRNAKASTRLFAIENSDRVEQAAVLQKMHQFYLEKVIPTHDAREGLQAFLEKRAPRWQNR